MSFERISISQALQRLGDVELEFTMIRMVDNRPRLADRHLVEPIAPFSSDAEFDQVCERLKSPSYLQQRSSCCRR